MAWLSNKIKDIGDFQMQHELRKKQIQDLEQQNSDVELQEKSNLMELEKIKSDAEAADIERGEGSKKEGFLTRAFRFIKNWFSFDKKNYLEGENKERNEGDSFQEFLIERVTFQEGYSSYANKAEDAITMVKTVEKAVDETTDDMFSKSISRSGSDKGENINKGSVDVIYKNRLRLLSPSADFKRGILFGSNTAEYKSDQAQFRFMGDYRNAKSSDGFRLFRDFSKGYDSLYSLISIEEFPLGDMKLSIDNLLVRDSETKEPDFSFVGGEATIKSDAYDVTLSKLSIRGNDLDTMKANQIHVKINKAPVSFKNEYDFTSASVLFKDSTCEIIPESETIHLGPMNFDQMIQTGAVDISLAQKNQLLGIRFAFLNYNIDIDMNPVFRIKGIFPEADASFLEQDGTIRLKAQEGNSRLFLFNSEKLSVPLTNPEPLKGYILGEHITKLRFEAKELEAFGLNMTNMKFDVGKEDQDWKADLTIGHLTNVSQEDKDAIRFLNEKNIFQLEMNDVAASLSKGGLEIRNLAANCEPGGEVFQSTKIKLSIASLLLSKSGISFENARGSLTNFSYKDIVTIESVIATASKKAGKEVDYSLTMENASVDTDIIPGIRFVASKTNASYDKEKGLSLSGNAKMIFGKGSAGIEVKDFNYKDGAFTASEIDGSINIGEIYGKSPLQGKLSVKGNNLIFGNQSTDFSGLAVSFTDGKLFEKRLPEISVELDNQKGMVFKLVKMKRWNFLNDFLFVENPGLSFAISSKNELDAIEFKGRIGFQSFIEGSAEGGVKLEKANNWNPWVSDLNHFFVGIPGLGAMTIGSIEQTEQGYDMKKLSMFINGEDKKETDQDIVPLAFLPFAPTIEITLEKASLQGNKIVWDSKDLKCSMKKFKFSLGNFTGAFLPKEKRVELTYKLEAPKDTKENEIPDLLDVSMDFPCMPAPVWVTAGLHAGAKVAATIAFNANYDNKNFLDANAGAKVEGAAKVGVYIGVKVGVPAVATGTIKLSGDLVASADGLLEGNTRILLNESENGKKTLKLDKGKTGLKYSLSGELVGKLTASLAVDVVKIFQKELFSLELAKISLGEYHLKGALVYGKNGFSLDTDSEFKTDFKKDLFNPNNPNSLIHKTGNLSDRQKKIQTMLDNCEAIGFESERPQIQTEQVSEMEQNILDGLEEILKTDEEALDTLNIADSNIIAAVTEAKKHILKQKNRKAAAEHLTGEVMVGVNDINALEASYIKWLNTMSPEDRQKLYENTGKSNERNQKIAVKNQWMKENLTKNLAKLDPLAALGAIRTIVPNDKLSKIKISFFSKKTPMEAAKELSVRNDRKRKGLLYDLPKLPEEEELMRSKEAFGIEQNNAKNINMKIAKTMKESYEMQSDKRKKIAELTKERLSLLAIVNESSEDFAQKDAQRILYEINQYRYEDYRKDYIKDNPGKEEKAKEKAQKRSNELQKTFLGIYNASLNKKNQDDENLRKNTEELKEAKGEYSVKRENRGILRVERRVNQFKEVRTTFKTARETYLSNITAGLKENNDSYFMLDETKQKKSVDENEKKRIEDEITNDNLVFLNTILGELNLVDYITYDYGKKVEEMNKNGFSADEGLLKELYSSNSISEAKKANKANNENPNMPLTIKQLDTHVENRIAFYEDNLNNIDKTRTNLEESVVWAGKQYKQAIQFFGKLKNLDTENMQVTYDNIKSGHQEIHRANAMFLAAEKKYIHNDKLNEELKKKKVETKNRFEGGNSNQYVSDVIKKLEVGEAE